MKEPTREEKLIALKKSTSQSEITYATAFRRSGKTLEEFNKTLKENSKKGLEPKPWCECHNRNPCPLDLEYERKVLKGL